MTDDIIPEVPMTHEQHMENVIRDHEKRIANLESQGKGNRKEFFFVKLESIKGIGRKTAGDIMEVYPNEVSLRKDIKANIKLPFRDDVEKILRETFK
jgi:hypothetical protein